MVILNMNLEVLGEMIDALAQQRNLHFGRAGVRLMNPELLDDTLFLLFSNSHNLRAASLFPFFSCLVSTTRPSPCKAGLDNNHGNVKVSFAVVN